MTAAKKPKKQKLPYSSWVEDTIKNIENLTDECLDRFYDDQKTNEEILKMLSKLKQIVEKKK
jgi:hypothetical protein